MTIFDFEGNPNALINKILQHRETATCTDCEWHITVVGRNTLNAFRDVATEKACLLEIEIELELVGTALQTLVDTHGFILDDRYQPKMMAFLGRIYVYCE